MSELTRSPGAWQALHVFYAANPQPLLVKCVGPLVADLDGDGLLAGHFFINYWLEGPHVRLRLKPATEEAAPEVRRRAEEAVDAFLRGRPALYEVDSGFLNEFYNTLFQIEFPEGDRGDFMAEDGRMRLRPNNSRSWEPYEPEYGKYGGPAGVALAEWHFAHSSDLVIDALGTMNLHLRTVLLGTSAQLMMVMASCFLTDDEELAGYLQRYYEFWHRAFPGTGFIGSAEYDRHYAEMAPRLGRRFGEIRRAVATNRLDALPAFLRGWAAHCLELRRRAAALAEAGELVFRSWDGSRDERVSDPALALPLLLSPYMHMTNNRLHVTIRDEAYLSHILGRVLRSGTAGATEAAS
ncbi:MAG: lantibiotic biosynthesis protein [Streptomyces sp.]|uniref:lantibiotic dehydratase C-terminal domain-containing protein n=1 Tax=Streptomyces sp. B93 TaxID=2824875 RepID=UPI0019C1BA9A|nr:lantibiotic dehydratase C-terminal domain-containing protein [Streptomyces sp. B93]MBC7269382.1 lantibiotic biosynthesis protein [Streptomyces sp.]MBQ1090480.1 lantibiotic biosynthesis protein [Streptomyces sp. B93]